MTCTYVFMPLDKDNETKVKGCFMESTCSIYIHNVNIAYQSN